MSYSLPFREFLVCSAAVAAMGLLQVSCGGSNENAAPEKTVSRKTVLPVKIAPLKLTYSLKRWLVKSTSPISTRSKDAPILSASKSASCVIGSDFRSGIVEVLYSDFTQSYGWVTT